MRKIYGSARRLIISSITVHGYRNCSAKRYRKNYLFYFNVIIHYAELYVNGKTDRAFLKNKTAAIEFAAD